MRRIGLLLALVAASIAVFLALRPSSAARRSGPTHADREAGESASRPGSGARAAAGVVVDAETKEPVPRARGHLYQVPDESPAEAAGTFVTDDAGGFSVPLAQDGPLMVIDADGYPPQPADFDPQGMTIELERGADRTVEILDHEGRPAAHADVDVFADDELRVRIATTRANAQGVVTLRVAGDVTLLVRHVGHAYESVWRDEPVRLRPGFAIGGKVVDSAGRPVPGAWIRLVQDATSDEHPAYPPPLLAKPDGTFHFDGIDGTWCVMNVRAAGYRDMWVDAAPGDEDLRVVVLRPASAAGNVVMPDGTRVPGASVGRGEYKEKEATDAEGGFRFEELAPQPYTFFAEAGPDLRGSLEVTPAEGEEIEDLHLVLQRPVRSRVRVHITDASGRPVPHAWVLGSLLRTSEDDYTDDDGMVTLTFDGPEGDVTLHTWPDKERSPPSLVGVHQIEARTVAPPREAPIVEVVMREGVLVRLDARAPDGTPVRRAQALLMGPANDVERGWYVDPAATYRVKAFAPGFADTEVEEWSVAKHGTTIAVTMQPYGSVRGRAVDAAGAPADWVCVVLDPDREGDRAWESPGPDGSFVVGRLLEGRGRLVAMGKDRVPGAVVDIETTFGEVTDVGTLTLVPPVVLTGRITDAEGRPLGGARVEMAGVPGFNGDAFSHADGTFRFAVPSFLRRDLLVKKAGFGTVRRDVRPGPSRPIGDIAMPEPGSLEVLVENVDWTDDLEFEVAWPGSTAVVARRYMEADRRPYRIADLAPGRYVVRLSMADVRREKEIRTVAGETTKVAFRLR